MSRYYALTAFDWQPFDDLVSNPASSAHAKLAEGLIATGMIKAEALAGCPEYQELLGDSLHQLLLAEEWYDGASQEDLVARGKVLDAVFNSKDPLWCYPTRGEFAVLWEIVQLIIGTIEIETDESRDEEWYQREVPGAVPRTRELQWLGNRPFRCRGWDGAELTQREFKTKFKRKPYSIHSPEQVALLQADIAGAADECRRLPFEELRDEYESLAGQIDKAVELGQALYVKHADPKDLRTRPPDYVIERMLQDVGIQVGPPKKKTYANPFFNELQCGDPKELAYVAKAREKEFPALGEDCEALGAQGNPAFCYRMCIAKCTWIIYDWHFGFRGALRPETAVKKGVEMSLRYFKVVRDRLGKATETLDWTEGAAWVEPYSEALLLATLAGCTHERTLLSDYLHSGLAVEKMALKHSEAAIGVALLCIAASFQSSPMDTAPLLKRLQKSRKKRPKLLFEAWQALRNGSQTKFTAALVDSTANFAKTTAGDDRPLSAIALQESILAGLAHERGWTNLSFDPPVAARLVTRHSLEMNEVHLDRS
ncbi:MAG TPA: hypothetical protein VMV10_08915 [Pirellulales bacterium]|nr:hypothetical protein [Pirellulales bacterium]